MASSYWESLGGRGSMARLAARSRQRIAKAAGSYFGECDRDEEGHCKPSGRAGEEGHEKPNRRGDEEEREKPSGDSELEEGGSSGEPEAQGDNKPAPAASSDDALARAKAADLVTLPTALQKGDGGTRCGNCQFVRGFGDEVEDYCEHKRVDQILKDGANAMCCALWDTPGTLRAWEE